MNLVRRAMLLLLVFLTSTTTLGSHKNFHTVRDVSRHDRDTMVGPLRRPTDGNIDSVASRQNGDTSGPPFDAHESQIFRRIGSSNQQEMMVSNASRNRWFDGGSM